MVSELENQYPLTSKLMNSIFPNDFGDMTQPAGHETGAGRIGGEGGHRGIRGGKGFGCFNMEVF